MYPFDYPHNCYNPRICNTLPNSKEDDQHSSPHFNHPPYPSTYHPPSYYHYGPPPHLPYVQPPPAPLPPYYYPHYYPPSPTYFIPPPPPHNFPMDHHHPCYDDYYKHQNNRPHCCGCSNHMCQPRNDATPSLRIQEEPFNQSEGKESDDVVPPSNHAPSIIWRLPSSDSVKANSNSKDKNVGKASEKDEVGKKDSQSPSYPVIWLPGNSGFEEMARDKNAAASKPAQERPSNFKFVPLKFLENGNRAEPDSIVQRVAPAADKMSNLRTIPIKKVDDREGNVYKAVEGEERNQSSNLKNVPLKCADNGEDRILEKDIQKEAHDPVEKKGIKVRTIPVKHEESSDKSCKMASDKDKKENKVEGKGESKTHSASEKKKLSTTKSSKLPPVCLRVDPRPKKTSANSSSTSKPTTSAVATSTSGAKNNKESNGGNGEPIREKMMPVNIVNACNQNEPVIPVNTVKDNKPSYDKKEQVSEECVTVASPEKNASMDDSSKVSEVISEESNIENLEKSMNENHIKTSEQKTNVDEEKVVESTGKIDEKTSGKRVLSETNAATIIQSAYRGFVVRRWHPLEKLKKIAKVRKETENIRRQVDDIEACPPHQLDAKKKVVLGETIMNLLLQLDTIQGLHPSVKEVRKSLAMELTSLEDKLESIYSRKAKEAESSKCESNSICSAPDTLNLESSEPDSTGFKVPASDAELQTKSDDGAVDVTSSTLVCEAAAHEHDVQVDDNGTKNNETTQKGKSSSLKDTVEEETSEVVKHPCSERDMDSTVSTTPSSSKPFKPASEEDINPSNMFVLQAEDGHVSSKQDSVVTVIEEEKDMSIVESPADYAEPNNASDELPNVNIASEDAPAKRNDSTSDNSESVSDKMSTSDAELQGRTDVSLDCSSSGDNAAVHVPSSTQHDLQVVDNAIKYLEIVEEEKLQPTNERVGEVKHPSFEREMNSTVSSASVEDMNPSNILEHQGVDEHFTLKDYKVSDLEEGKGHSEENRETGSIVERPADYIEPNIASDELPGINDASNRVVEPMIGEEERSSAIKANGESIVIGNESDNTSEAAMVDEDKQVVSEGFDAPRNIEDACTKKVEIDCKNEVFVSNEDSNVSIGKEGDELKKEEVQLMEENESLRKMIEKLVQSGNKQLDVINNLNGRVKDLEKKLQQTKKRRMKVRRNRAVKNHSTEVQDD